MPNTWGGARPGAGRKSYPHLREFRELVDEAVSHQDRVGCVQVLFAMARSYAPDQSAAQNHLALDAQKLILHYLYGLPEPVEEKEDKVVPISFIEIHRSCEQTCPIHPEYHHLSASGPSGEPDPPIPDAWLRARAERRARGLPDLPPISLAYPDPPGPVDEPVPAPVPLEPPGPADLLGEYDTLDEVLAAFSNAPELRHLPPEIAHASPLPPSYSEGPGFRVPPSAPAVPRLAPNSAQSPCVPPSSPEVPTVPPGAPGAPLPVIPLPASKYKYIGRVPLSRWGLEPGYTYIMPNGKRIQVRGKRKPPPPASLSPGSS